MTLAPSRPMRRAWSGRTKVGQAFQPDRRVRTRAAAVGGRTMPALIRVIDPTEPGLPPPPEPTPPLPGPDIPPEPEPGPPPGEPVPPRPGQPVPRPGRR